MVAEWSTVYGSHFTWPRSAERQRTIDRDNDEDEEHRRENAHRSPQTERPMGETLPKTHSPEPQFDLQTRPKSILAPEQSVSSHPSEACEVLPLSVTKKKKTVIEHDKDKEDARIVRMRKNTRRLISPQLNLNDLPADKREIVCASMYITSKAFGELTSGIPRCPSIFDQVPPPRPSVEPVKHRCKSLCKSIHPAKNLRKVSIEWDSKQKRIFGGRSVD